MDAEGGFVEVFCTRSGNRYSGMLDSDHFAKSKSRKHTVIYTDHQVHNLLHQVRIYRGDTAPDITAQSPADARREHRNDEQSPVVDLTRE